MSSTHTAAKCFWTKEVTAFADPPRVNSERIQVRISTQELPALLPQAANLSDV